MKFEVGCPTDICTYAAQGRSSYRYVQISVHMQLEVDRPTAICTYASLFLHLTDICTCEARSP